MTIKNMIRAGSLIIGAIVTIAAFVGATKINTIRMGGPLQTANQQMSDLVADILPPPAYVLEAYLESTLLLKHPEQISARKARLSQLEQDFRTRMNVWKESSIPDDIKKLLTSDAYAPAESFWKHVDDGLLPAAARGDTDAMDHSYAQISEDYAEHRKAIDATVAAALGHQQTLGARSASELSQSIWLLSALGVALLALLAIAALGLLRRVVKPVEETANIMTVMAAGNNQVTLIGGERADEIGKMISAVETFRRAAIAREEAEREIASSREAQARTVAALGQALTALAKGDLAFRLSQPFPESYEMLRKDFNAALEAFQTTMIDVSLAAEGIRTGSSEISVASDDLSRRTEQQAASLEETAAAMDQVTSSVKDTARSAGEVSATVAQAQSDAQEGGRVVREAVEAMGGIEKSSQEIAQIISTIDGIAFQTNLLALNAGVEAARAGDAGKGFAVVASEVRALAQRSADAAKEIKELITVSTHQVDTGVKLVSRTGEALDRIMGKVGETAGLIQQIAQTAQEQAGAITQVNSVVGDMDKMTQQNAAMVEQSTAAARSLAGEADRLAGLVDQFTLGEQTTKRKTATPARPAPPVARTAPRSAGNLAIAQPDEDWTEF